MIFRNSKGVVCLALVYIIVLLYSCGNIYTTIFFQDTVSTQNLVFTPLANNSMAQSLPVIVKPVGGLGNQLFQYSVSYSVARRRNSELYICLQEKDVHAMSGRNESILEFRSLDRSYILDVFNIPHDKLLVIPKGEKECPLKTLPGNFTQKDLSIFTDGDLMINKISKDKVVQFDGYGESEMFFHDFKAELLDLFTMNLDTQRMPREISIFFRNINKTESVAVHVRRGDFNRYSRTIPNSYYVKAMKIITEEISKTNDKSKDLTFFVFSDDIETVEKEFSVLFKNENYKIIYSTSNTFSRVVDFYLMTNCKHNIIANSTFSWWAAYLNRNLNKTVIAPLPKFKSNWYYKIAKTYKYIFGAEWNYPATWITLNPFE